MTLGHGIWYLGFHLAYGLVKYLPTFSGDVFRYVVLKLFLKRLKGWVAFRDNVTIWFPEGISIDAGCLIGENCFLDGFSGLTIGRDVLIAHNTSIVAEDHGFASRRIPIRRQAKTTGPIVIEDDVWIGCGARILKGVTVGKGSIIGAGAVVTSNVPPYSIFGGVPARMIGTRPDDTSAYETTDDGSSGPRAS